MTAPTTHIQAAVYRVSLIADAPDQPGLYPWPEQIQILDRTYTLETRGVASPRHATATYVNNPRMISHTITLYPS